MLLARKIRRPNLVKSLSVTLLLAFDPRCAQGAAPPKQAKHESHAVLDELEQALGEQTLGPTSHPQPKKPSPKVRTSKKSTPAPADDAESSTLIQASVSQELVELQQRIQQLAQQAQGLQATIRLQQAQLRLNQHWDNLVKIEVKLTTPDNIPARIQGLQLRIDGHRVYTLEPLQSAWFTQTAFVVYEGPLPPGTHHIDLSSKIALLTSRELPLATDAFRSEDKSFDLEVPLNSSQRLWTITLRPETKSDSGIQTTGIQTGIEVRELKKEELERRNSHQGPRSW